MRLASQLDELNCDTNDTYLISAIERAKSEFCRIQIKSVFCLNQNEELYPNLFANHHLIVH